MKERHFFRKAAAAAAFTSTLVSWFLRPGREHQEEIAVLSAVDYAHRGLHDAKTGIPENSLAAFRRAAEQGFGMELDVHLTKDGEFVVIHDHDTVRMTGYVGKVEEMTLAELRGLKLADTDEPIPTFREVLDCVDGKVPLLIEIKPLRYNMEELTEKVCTALAEYKGPYCIECFDPRVVALLRRNHPEIVRGQLLMYLHKNNEFSQPAVVDFSLRNLLTNFWTRPDFITYHFPEKKNLTLRLCRKLFHVWELDWTVTDEIQYQAVKQDGCTAIFEQFIPKC